MIKLPKCGHCNTQITEDMAVETKSANGIDKIIFECKCGDRTTCGIRKWQDHREMEAEILFDLIKHKMIGE